MDIKFLESDNIQTSSAKEHFKENFRRYFRLHIKGEHWCGTIIGGVKNRGEINWVALQFFQNLASFKRYMALKFKIFNFLSSLVVVWTYFGRSFGRTFS